MLYNKLSVSLAEYFIAVHSRSSVVAVNEPTDEGQDEEQCEMLRHQGDYTLYSSYTTKIIIIIKMGQGYNNACARKS